MDCLRNKPYLNLTSINTVQLHLKILYVSDITSHDGKHILQVQTENQKAETGRQTKLHWPIQPPQAKKPVKNGEGH